MSNVRNPEYKPHRGLPEAKTDEEWNALKAIVLTYLRTNAGRSLVAVADLRALDLKLGDDRTWNQLAGDLGLTEVPE